MDMDKTDQHILNVLTKDARLSCRAIARIIKVSTATVAKRIKALEHEGIIRGYSAMLDYDKLSYQMQVAIEVRVSHGKEQLIEKKFLHDNHITAIYDMTGDFDILLIARFTTRKSLNAFVKKIQTYEYIERTKTLLILNVMKEQAMEIE